MDRTNRQQPPLSLESQVDEDRVRRALGLHTSGTPQQRPEGARHRHRFVSDGAVPVVMLNRADGENGGLKEKLVGAEAALEAERAAHAGTRRALADLQTTYQALQTRVAHAKLAQEEALAAERRAREAAEEALAALRTEAREEPKRAVRTLAEPKPVGSTRRTRVKREKDQKPVRWWTPSYRAKQAKPIE